MGEPSSPLEHVQLTCFVGAFPVPGAFVLEGVFAVFIVTFSFSASGSVAFLLDLGSGFATTGGAGEAWDVEAFLVLERVLISDVVKCKSGRNYATHSHSDSTFFFSSRDLTRH